MSVAFAFSDSLLIPGAVHRTACEALASGMSVVPIRQDGTKQPALARWREYQTRRANEREIASWFRSGDAGIAFITGSVSGHLEALDFDCCETFEAWSRLVQGDQALSFLCSSLLSGYLEETPAGGKHILYRCPTISGNQKLASCPDDKQRKTLIETRGEGGLIIVAPSGRSVHPSHKPYRLLRGGVSSIRTITTHQRALLLASARQFDRTLAPTSASLSTVPSRKLLCMRPNDDERPGDVFNRVASWEDILLPHGWQCVRSTDTEGYWRRPEKCGPGISATTNYHGSDLFYVFTTSTVFEAGQGYSKFRVYTLLNHAGDFSAAARALVEQGYVSSKR